MLLLRKKSDRKFGGFPRSQKSLIKKSSISGEEQELAQRVIRKNVIITILKLIDKRMVFDSQNESKMLWGTLFDDCLWGVRKSRWLQIAKHHNFAIRAPQLHRTWKLIWIWGGIWSNWIGTPLQVKRPFVTAFKLHSVALLLVSWFYEVKRSQERASRDCLKGALILA